MNRHRLVRWIRFVVTGAIAVPGVLAVSAGQAGAVSGVNAAAFVGEIPEPFEVTLGADGFEPDWITVVPGQTIVFSMDDRTTYQTLVDAFAEGVVERLN